MIQWIEHPKVNKRAKCPFCGKFMFNVCKCGAYAVTTETRHLPLHKQPYMNVVL